MKLVLRRNRGKTHVDNFLLVFLGLVLLADIVQVVVTGGEGGPLLIGKNLLGRGAVIANSDTVVIILIIFKIK